MARANENKGHTPVPEDPGYYVCKWCGEELCEDFCRYCAEPHPLDIAEMQHQEDQCAGLENPHAQF